MKEITNHIDYILLGKKLAGETSPEEEKYILEWLGQSEKYKVLFGKLEHVYNNPEAYRYVNGIDLNGALKKVQKNEYHNIIVTLRFFLRIAAILIIFICIGFTAMQIMHSMKYIVLETGENQRNTKIMTDGTEVTLNENSTLKYAKRYGKSSREVELHGEAYFVVTRNTEMPFLVKTTETCIKVLGTEFNVNAVNPDEVTVIVNRGKVELSAKQIPAGNSCIIEKGYECTYSSLLKKCLVNGIEDENAIAWKTKQFKFRNKGLPEVLDKLEKVYSIHFITNEKINKRRLTAAFYNQPVDSIIEILKTTLHVDIKKQNNNEYVFMNE